MGNSRTDFLFSTPSFVGGIGTVVNIGGQYYSFNSSPSTVAADARALRSDFAVTGRDILEVVETELTSLDEPEIAETEE